MQLLREALEDGAFVLDAPAHSIEEILHFALDAAIESGKFDAAHRDQVYEGLLARERQGSTAIGHSVAVPHAYLEAVDEPLIIFVRLKGPLNLNAPDGIATRFVFVLLGPPGTANVHIEILMRIARLMADDEFRYDAAVARDRQGVVDALNAFEERTAPREEVGEADIPDGLHYTGKFAGGVIGDLRRRLPQYAEHIRAGFHRKCLGSSLFLYFACLAPTVTFGGLMSEATGDHIGAVEMMISVSIGGVIYALIGGHPLVILGGTGPMLVLTGILYELAVRFDLPFLELYGWIGLWAGLILALIALLDGSCLIRFFTRFTDETFSALISAIYIFQAVAGIVAIFVAGFFASTTTRAHDTALLSIILALGTFWVAKSLSAFRRSRYLRPSVREFFADFGPTIAVLTMTIVAMWLKDVKLASLNVPESIQPTFDRSWFINPLSNELSLSTKLLCAIPAMFVAVLVYLDHHITARLVNSPDHKLGNSEAYHWDLLLIAGMVGTFSLFGLPWLVAATVRSLNHVRSLATSEEINVGGGGTRERIIHVRENRITGLTIHLLIGCSLAFLTYLKFIPLAVLFGLFLFMGVVSISGNQFFERLSLWLMDADLYPRTHYTRTVPMRWIHLFTLIQFACLVVLWIVKESAIGILFPLFIALLVPVRYAMNRYFKPEYLAALDAEEEPEEEVERYN